MSHAESAITVRQVPIGSEKPIAEQTRADCDELAEHRDPSQAHDGLQPQPAVERIDERARTLQGPEKLLQLRGSLAVPATWLDRTGHSG